MAKNDTIVINITTEYKDNINTGESLKKADKLTESLKRTQKQANDLDSQKSEIDISANDKAIAVIEKANKEANSFNKSRARSELSVLDKASSVIEKVTSATKSFTNKTFKFTVGIIDKATAPLRSIFNFATSIKGLLTGLIAGAAADQFIVKPTQMAIQQQNIETAFENLLGSKDAAKQRVEDLTSFAGKTPFTRDEIYEASRTLQVFTGSALSTADGLKTVGDVASGTQQDFRETAVWFGRLYDGIKNGTPIGEAAARLQEMGAISGESRSKLEALAKSGRDISETWPEATAEFAQFDGMMEKMSDGFQNLLLGAKTFVNNNIWKRIGNGIVNGFTPALQRFREWRSENKVLISQMAEDIEKEVTKMVSKVSGGLENFFDITSKLMGTSSFQNAGLSEKAGMLWDSLIEQPFSQWWSQGGRDTVVNGVKDAANEIKNILINVLGEAFNLAFSNPITGSAALIYGAKYGFNIVKGVKSGLDTVKSIKDKFLGSNTIDNITEVSGTASSITPNRKSYTSTDSGTDIQNVAKRYCEATDTLSKAKIDFSKEQQTLVEKSNELKELKSAGEVTKVINSAEKSLEKSRKMIKLSAANIENIKINEYKTAKEAFSKTLSELRSPDVSGAAYTAEKAIGNMGRAAESGTKSTSAFSGATSGLSAVLSAIPLPVKIAIGAIGLAVAGFAIYTKKQEEYRQSLLDSGKDYLTASDKFKEANKNYEEQSAKLKEQADVVQRYRDLTNEINTGGFEDDVLNQKLQERDDTLLSIKEHYPAAFGEGVSNEEGIKKVDEMIEKEQDYQKLLLDRAKIELANVQTELVLKIPDLKAEKEKLQKELDGLVDDRDLAIDIEAKITTVNDTANKLAMQVSTQVDPAEIEETKRILSEQIGDTLKSLREAPGEVQRQFQTVLSGIQSDIYRGVEIPQEKFDKLHDAFSGIESYANSIKDKYDQTELKIATIEKNIALGNGVLDEMKKKTDETKSAVDETRDSAAEANKNVKDTDSAMGNLAKTTLGNKNPMIDTTNAWTKSWLNAKDSVNDVNTEINNLPSDKRITVEIVTKHSTIGVPSIQNSEITEENKAYFEKLGLIPESANGRITNGPMISLVGEDGAEAIIPLSAKRRDRGLALWQEAGKRLGVMSYASGGVVGNAGSSSRVNKVNTEARGADYKDGLIKRAEIELANVQTELVLKIPDLKAEKEKLQKELDGLADDRDLAIDIEAKITTVNDTANKLAMQVSTQVDPAEIEETKRILSEQIGDTSRSLGEDPGKVQQQFKTVLSGIQSDIYEGVEIPQKKFDKSHEAFYGIENNANGVKDKFKQTELKIATIDDNVAIGNVVFDEMKKKTDETKGAVNETRDSAGESNKNVGYTDTAMGNLRKATLRKEIPMRDATNFVTKHSTIGVPSIQNSEITEENKAYFEKLGLIPHANGGIMNRPHLGLVAKDGDESIIPLSSKRRRRGLALWEETGRKLGVPGYAGGTITETKPPSSDNGQMGKILPFTGQQAIVTPQFDGSGIDQNISQSQQSIQNYNAKILTDTTNSWNMLNQAVSEKSQSLNDSSKSKFADFSEYFQNFGTGIVTTGASASEQLRQGVVTTTTGTVDFSIGKFDEFITYMGTLPSEFRVVGHLMISELQSGIESQRASVLSSTSSLVQDLLDTFITGLGIHSPSKVMQWIGEMMAAGIIKGLSADQINSYVLGLIDRMQNSFSSGKLDVGQVVNKLDDNIPALVAKLGVDPSEAASLFYPLIGTAGDLTSVFGGRDAPTAGASTNHGGIDLAAPTGTQIAAVLGGMVTIAGDYGGYGNAVQIDHGNGVESLYGHMSSVGVAPGQQVSAGQVIGQVGSTGISTGSHLHLSMYKDGAAVDPLPYVQGAPIMAGNTLAGALMAEYNRRKFGGMAVGTLTGGGDLSSWLMQALAITGQSIDYLDELMYIAQMESGGDPNAINLWDSNAAAGHPSKGLMQTIDSTFGAYKLPGFDDIWNPVHNAVAAIRYMMDCYGGISGHPGLGSGGYVGYDVGTREVPQDMLAMIHKGEAIFPADKNPFTKSGGDMIGDMVGNIAPFPEMGVQDFQQYPMLVPPVAALDASNSSSSNISPIINISVGGITLKINTGEATNTQEIMEIIKVQLPGIANELCEEIAYQLSIIFGGMATKAS